MFDEKGMLNVVVIKRIAFIILIKNTNWLSPSADLQRCVKQEYIDIDTYGPALRIDTLSAFPVLAYILGFCPWKFCFEQNIVVDVKNDGIITLIFDNIEALNCKDQSTAILCRQKD